MERATEAAHLRETARKWRRLLGSVFALLVLLVWVAFVEHTAYEHRMALAAVAQRDANLATAVEHYTGRVLRNALAVHRLFGDMVAQGREEIVLRQMLADRLRANDAFSELGLCLPGGRVLAAPLAGRQLTPAACARIDALTRPGPDVRVLPRMGAPGAPQVPLALAIEGDGGERMGVAVAFTPAMTLLGIMQSVVLQDATTVVVSGDDGEPRAAWRSQGGYVRDAAGLAALGGLLRSRGDTADIGGQPQLVSARALPEAGLRIHVATARHDALAAFYTRRLRYLGVYGLASLFLATVYVLLSRMHAESLQRALALERARGELEALNARLDSQVQERTAQLEQAYRDLETFSYTVAHDVRAPLASIAGFADALEPAVRATGDDRQLHYLRRIQANAAQMETFTQHLLELGRLTRAPVERREVDLSAMAAEVFAQLREREPARAVEVCVEPGLAARGDPALLRQVLENLLGNAWKFSARRTPAHIAFGRESQAEGGPAFHVTDDGEGFDSATADGLFQPFRRMHAASEFPGTGVGLAMVQRIVALHGGRIWCDARPGQGARFVFTLPEGPAAAGPSPP